MPIVIERVSCRVVDYPLREERVIVSSAGRHDRSTFLQVSVMDRDGRRGFGEAATSPLWSGESAQTARVMIEELMAPRLRGATISDPREVVTLLNGTTVLNNFTKSALEIAVWDVFARSVNKRLVELFADRAPVEAIPSRASVGCYDVPTTVRIAREFWAAGVRTIKFKTGVKGFSDVERLRAVRKELGDAPIFTIDANCGYETEDEAVRAIESLAPFNLALVEQPTPRERLAMLARVRRRVAPIPILADESIFTPGDLDEALDLDAFDLLSIYPGKNGGLTNAINMANTAAKAGKFCAIGSNLESDLGQAAMAAIASGLRAFPVQRLACDVMSSLFYRWPTTAPALEIRDGSLIMPRGAGLGVEPLP